MTVIRFWMTCRSKTPIKSDTAQSNAAIPEPVRSGCEASVMSWQGSSDADVSAICACESKVSLSLMMSETLLRKSFTVLTSLVHCVIEAFA